jgi:hypothetical protein
MSLSLCYQTNGKSLILLITKNYIMKPNSKEVRLCVQKHILECVTTSEGEQFATLQEVKEYVLNRFNSEYNGDYEKRNYPKIQERFKNYLLGMPFDFTTWNDEIVQILNSWGLYKENATIKQSANLYYYLIFSEVFK